MGNQIANQEIKDLEFEFSNIDNKDAAGNIATAKTGSIVDNHSRNAKIGKVYKSTMKVVGPEKRPSIQPKIKTTLKKRESAVEN